MYNVYLPIVINNATHKYETRLLAKNFLFMSLYPKIFNYVLSQLLYVLSLFIQNHKNVLEL